MVVQRKKDSVPDERSSLLQHSGQQDPSTETYTTFNPEEDVEHVEEVQDEPRKAEPVAGTGATIRSVFPVLLLGK